MKKMIDRLVDVILIFVIVCLVYYLLTGLTTGKPNVFGYRIFYIPTESMMPVIHPGDFVIGVPVDYEDVQVGDIVTYKSKSNGITICHRVIERTEEGLVFKGDNNVETDNQLVRFGEIGYRIILRLGVHYGENEEKQKEEIPGSL